MVSVFTVGITLVVSVTVSPPFLRFAGAALAGIVFGAGSAFAARLGLPATASGGWARCGMIRRGTGSGSNVWITTRTIGAGRHEVV